MKPLPDLDDVRAMAATGRRSVLMRARNEACEALRDATTRCQSAEVDEARHAHAAIEAAQRLIEVAGIWKYVGEDGLTATLKASIDLARERNEAARA